MTDPSDLSQQAGLSRNQWFLVVVATAICSLAISNASFWIDEGFSAMMASQPTLAAWVHTLNNQQGSDSQLLGYYLYLWVWSRIFGVSELALRLGNLPWIFLFMASFASTWVRLSQTRYLWLTVCLSPFLWTYANEARPYMMVMALSMAATAGLFSYFRSPSDSKMSCWLVVGATLVLWFTHMLTIAVVPSLAILAWYIKPQGLSRHEIWKAWRRPLIAFLPLYIALTAYFAFTILSGRGGQRETPGLSNLAFALYEFLGFDGLGPPRGELRTIGMHAFLPYVGWIALGIAALLVVGFYAVVQWRKSDELRLRSGLIFSLITGALLIFALSYAAGFRLVGRHLAAFFPLFALLFLLLISQPRASRLRPLALVSLLSVAVAWSVSDLRSRVLARYQKDDYRGAVALAKRAQDQGYELLWLADPVTARYYGLPLVESLTATGHSQLSTSAFPTKCDPALLQAEISKHKRIYAVLTDRPYYDENGTCRRIVETSPGQHIATLEAFNTWDIEVK